jgi:hypothetical protein
MHALNGEELLIAWEHSRQRPKQEAVLSLLALALPERSISELARMPLGERNVLLLELRADTLGSAMEGRAVCPGCGMQLEFELDARQLAQGLREQAAASAEELDGIAMRPVNTQDLLASARAASEDEARLILLERTASVRQAEPGSAEQQEVPLRSLPVPVTSALVTSALIEKFEKLNAAAEIQVQLQCVGCDARPRLDLDIASYLVREIAGAARRLMAEIHQLASAYGWSEESIARMSGARRAAYLEMLNA